MRMLWQNIGDKSLFLLKLCTGARKSGNGINNYYRILNKLFELSYLI